MPCPFQNPVTVTGVELFVVVPFQFAVGIYAPAKAIGGAIGFSDGSEPRVAGVLQDQSKSTGPALHPKQDEPRVNQPGSHKSDCDPPYTLSHCGPNPAEGI